MELRPDLKNLEIPLQRLLQFAEVFNRNNHDTWSRLRNQEDFDQIYQYDVETRTPLESVYSSGRDLAVHMSRKLDAFNDPSSYPTIEKYLESFRGGWLDQIPELEDVSNKAKSVVERLPHTPWAVDQMVALFDNQLALLGDVRVTLDEIRRCTAESTNSHSVSTISHSVHAILKMILGDPAIRFAKCFALAGFAMICTPWWQPILENIAIHYLHLPPEFARPSSSSVFWSGWVFVAISIALYVWAKSTSQVGVRNA